MKFFGVVVLLIVVLISSSWNEQKLKFVKKEVTPVKMVFKKGADIVLDCSTEGFPPVRSVVWLSNDKILCESTPEMMCPSLLTQNMLPTLEASKEYMIECKVSNEEVARSKHFRVSVEEDFSSSTMSSPKLSPSDYSDYHLFIIIIVFLILWVIVLIVIGYCSSGAQSNETSLDTSITHENIPMNDLVNSQ